MTKIVVADIETNALDNPDKLWCVCTSDVETSEKRSFVFEDGKPTDEFKAWAKTVDVWIGHNFLGYDAPNLNRLCGDVLVDSSRVVDTLVVARTVNFNGRDSHSLESYGETFNVKKVGLDVDFSSYSNDIVERCVRDVEINLLVYNLYKSYIYSSKWKDALRTEHLAALDALELRLNGFYFNVEKAKDLYKTLSKDQENLDEELYSAFPPRFKITRYEDPITPVLTKHGTISRSRLKFLGENLSHVSAGSPFCRVDFSVEEFNPKSNKQRVERLNAAGWKPVERTNGHKEFLKGGGRKDKEKLKHYQEYGWKVNELNLATLPDDAPSGARKLADRIIVGSRVAKLEEWLNVYNENTHRIHGDFQSIGTWPGRMSHSRPNMANVPSTERRKPHQWWYAGEMRALWGVPDGALLVGADADAIHLRIFAHLTNDQSLAHAIHTGKKEDGTSAHWINAKRLGLSGNTAYNRAKVFIYTWLNGGKPNKIAEILECSVEEAANALRSFETSTPAIRELLEQRIPADAARGYFEGLDGRYVGYDSEHGMMAGYLQNGEATIMKMARQMWKRTVEELKIIYKWVNFIHDEWQTEVYGGYEKAKLVGEAQVRSIVDVGRMLNMRCPLNGDYRVGLNWKETH